MCVSVQSAADMELHERFAQRSAASPGALSSTSSKLRLCEADYLSC